MKDPVILERTAGASRPVGFAAQVLHAASVLGAGLAASALGGRVLAAFAAGQDREVLGRALPGPLAVLFTQLSRSPVLIHVLFALVPVLVALCCGAIVHLLRADGVRAVRGQTLVWTVSAVISLITLAAGVEGLKPGMAALGYALAWPAVGALGVVLWSSAQPRGRVFAVWTLVVLAGWVLRLLPVGWPGQNSLTWWAMLPARPPLEVVAGIATLALAAVLARVVPRRAQGTGVAWRLLLATGVSVLLLRALPAFEHYGPAKPPAALASEISTSYLQVALTIDDAPEFARQHADRLRTYPMHARTHSPVWPLLFRAAIRAGASPVAAPLARGVAWVLGGRFDEGAELARSVAAGSVEIAPELAARPLSDDVIHGLWLLTGVLALATALLPIACYGLVRAFADADSALHAAAWVPWIAAPLVYFPAVDVLYPVLFVLATSAWLNRDRALGWALVAGAVVALLVALSYGNLALLLTLGLVPLLTWGQPARRTRRELLAAALLIAPLAALLGWAASSGLRPLAMFAAGMAQHRAILAHRSLPLWVALNPLECVVALGLPTALCLFAGVDWRAIVRGARAAALDGASAVLAATALTLAVLDVGGQTKGEAGRLWMGFFPLLVAGAAPVLVARARDWHGLVPLSALTLLVLQGFYVFVWLYPLR